MSPLCSSRSNVGIVFDTHAGRVSGAGEGGEGGEVQGRKGAHKINGY
ncbi:MAG: hypothetical protein IJ348_02095 [Alistipes sp.]|nr:hypothetical protein [Alistipes sp.]